MPWIAHGVHVIFADPRREAEHLRRRLAGEIAEEHQELKSVRERAFLGARGSKAISEPSAPA